jgi:hypothetical protein
MHLHVSKSTSHSAAIRSSIPTRTRQKPVRALTPVHATSPHALEDWLRHQGGMVAPSVGLHGRELQSVLVSVNEAYAVFV